MKSLALCRNAKDELVHFFKQLLVTDAASAPAMHAKVALRVKVAVR